jgi:hypothetical protein
MKMIHAKGMPPVKERSAPTRTESELFKFLAGLKADHRQLQGLITTLTDVVTDLQLEVADLRSSRPGRLRRKRTKTGFIVPDTPDDVVKAIITKHIDDVAKEFSLPVVTLRMAGVGGRKASAARQELWARCFESISISLEALSEIFNADRATIRHGIKKVRPNITF